MKPLISIETVPISIEMEYVSKPAQRRAILPTPPEAQAATAARQATAKLRISQAPERVTISSNPIQIPLKDRFEYSMQRYMAYTATAEYSNDGKLQMNVRIQPPGDPSAAIRFQGFGNSIDRMVDAVPREPAPIQSSMPLIGMKINFDMAQLENSRHPEVDTAFIPPDLEVEVVEYPKVVIKYVGGPLYFPKSADPNYEPTADEVAARQAAIEQAVRIGLQVGEEDRTDAEDGAVSESPDVSGLNAKA